MDAQLSTVAHPKTTLGKSADLSSLWFLWRWCLAILIGLLWTTAIAIALKRLFGALSVPLEPVAFVATGIVLALATAGIRTVWNMAPRQSPWRTFRWLQLVALGSPLLAVVIFGLAITLPGTPVAAQVGFWTLVLSAEMIALHRVYPVRWFKHKTSTAGDTISTDHSAESSESATATTPNHPTLNHPTLEADLRVDPPQIPVPHIPSENVSQQFTRHVEADGSDVLQGWVRTSFAPRQRTASAHIAFCPPFERMPSLHFEQIEGPPTRVKQGQLLLYGVRLDLRLDFELDEPAAVLLEFSVRLSPAHTEQPV